MILTQPGGFIRAEAEIEQPPTVNDLATLLAHAMQHALVEGQFRSRRIHLPGNPKWKPLSPTLKELDIEFVIKTDVPEVEQVFGDFLAVLKPARSVPTVEAVRVLRLRSAVARLWTTPK